MANLQTIFKPKQEKIAEFNAYVTNSIIFKDEKGNLIPISKSEINEKITQLYTNKNFNLAGELLKSAKKLLKGQGTEVAEVVSKSIRLDSVTYMKSQEIAHKKNLSLSDTIRTTSIQKMKQKLDEYKNEPSVDQEKVGIINDLLKSWEDKNPTSPDKEYFPQYNCTITNETKELLSEFIEYSILDDCKEEGIPIEDVRDFISSFYIDWEGQEIFPEVSLSFNLQSNLFELDIMWPNFLVIFQDYNAFKENIDINLHNKLDNVFKFNDNLDYNEENDCLNYYPLMPNTSSTIHIENDKLFFDSVDAVQRDALNA
ncbi:MAG: hypothetical protein KKH84_00465, partial [Proteobacteria bacterium]|nr:hypothetical protein [Pseudomonadota bacterium]